MKKLLSFILAVGITSNLCVFAQNSGENEIGQDLLEHEKFMQIEQERVESENPIFEESLLNENQVLSKAEGEWYGDLLFDKITGTITDANTGISGDLVIPSEIDGVSVTTIGHKAFYFCRDLTSVEMPNSVTTIDDYAFSSCVNLISIEIPNSVATIGTYAFEHCRSLTSIQIPDSITSIGNYVFYNCGSLISINVDEKNEYYIADEHGVLFNIDKTELLQYPIGNERTSYIIPNTVTSIVDGAFSDCLSLTSIEIPNSVTTIGNDAFENCYNLTNIQIPNSVTAIGDNAFYYCEGLTNIEIPNSVTTIGDSAFSYCNGLTSINVDEGNEYYIADEYGVLFNIDKTELLQYPIGNERTSYIIPNTVTSIGDRAFGSCKKTNKYRITQ